MIDKSSYLYTCRYFSGHLIPTIELCQYKLGINYPLEYMQVYRWPLLFPYFL